MAEKRCLYLRSEHPKAQAPWKRQLKTKTRAGAAKGAAWSLEAAEAKVSGREVKVGVKAQRSFHTLPPSPGSGPRTCTQRPAQVRISVPKSGEALEAAFCQPLLLLLPLLVSPRKEGTGCHRSPQTGGSPSLT